MNKKIFIINALVLASSYNLFASTGNANDGLLFVFVIIGFLLFLLGVFSAVNYLKNNGKKMLYKAKSFINETISIFKKHLNKLKSYYIEPIFFLIIKVLKSIRTDNKIL